jgi:hypothetical protein
MKYRILFAKKVTSRQYENITFSYEIESDDGEIPAEYAKAFVVGKVNDWIDAELRSMGLLSLQKAL